MKTKGRKVKGLSHKLFCIFKIEKKELFESIIVGYIE